MVIGQSPCPPPFPSQTLYKITHLGWFTPYGSILIPTVVQIILHLFCRYITTTHIVKGLHILQGAINRENKGGTNFRGRFCVITMNGVSHFAGIFVCERASIMLNWLQCKHTLGITKNLHRSVAMPACPYNNAFLLYCWLIPQGFQLQVGCCYKHLIVY